MMLFNKDRATVSRRYVLISLLLFALLASTPLLAQDTANENGVSYGGQISGQITNSKPRSIYYFDGLRGEVVSITLTTTKGDLDPVLTVMDANGTIIAAHDDSRGSRDVTINALSVPQSSRYYIVVGRFGYGLGSTTGEFSLDVERIGVSSASGSALRYGDSVINNITNMQAQVYYSFQAQRGDIIDVRMLRDSGNLDSYLQVVDSKAFVVADNDDVLGSGSLDAGINGLVIQATGTYVIVATRYGEAAGTSSGRFILTLEEASNSGLGNSAQAAIPILFNDAQEGEITDHDFAKYYTFDAKKNDLITIRMSRLKGSVDSFLALADANLQELVTDDDSGGGQNAKIEGYLIPADGTYYIIATRLDREKGTTAGRYKLELQSLGNAFDGVPPGTQRISYGTTITGRVDDATPEVMFAFWGIKGDAVTISLNRGDGDLDPVLNILNSDQNVVKQDDDSGGGQNARIARYVLPRTGIYYIRATRFSGTDGNPHTAGSFILVLARVFQSS
jgi:pre-peptidase